MIKWTKVNGNLPEAPLDGIIIYKKYIGSGLDPHISVEHVHDTSRWGMANKGYYIATHYTYINEPGEKDLMQEALEYVQRWLLETGLDQEVHPSVPQIINAALGNPPEDE